MKREGDSTRARAGGVSRRQFLGRIGAGAAGAIAAGTGSGLVTGQDPAAALTPTANAFLAGRFGRIFRLQPFALPSSALTAALLDIGKPGGILDARDNLAAGPVALITDPALNVNNPNNSTSTAGATFVGQFIDHDITFDTGSRMNQPVHPEAVANSRTPSLDLDSVYGGGPVGSPQLYQAGDKAKFRAESGGRFEDLPRFADGSAIVADPRNDENMVISGLQCAFLLFHNRTVDGLRSQGITDVNQTFARARALTTWHYQWIVVKEILPGFVGPTLVNEVLANGNRFYRPPAGAASMPVEFQAAAYRMGHSMIRPSYRANLAGDNGQPFFAMVFDAARSNEPDPPDLSGGHRAPRRFIGWQTFFDFGDGEVKPNKKVDTKLSSPLFALPLRAIASGDQPTVLPQRTLLRHVTWSLPSGQAIAAQMGAPVLSAGDLRELAGYGLNLDRSTPLWYYVLKEAELLSAGERLGPVGGRIVAEVLIGLLRADAGSFLNQPNWTPTHPRRDGSTTGAFRMVDFLTFAGVDPRSRGQ